MKQNKKSVSSVSNGWRNKLRERIDRRYLLYCLMIDTKEDFCLAHFFIVNIS